MLREATVKKTASFHTVSEIAFNPLLPLDTSCAIYKFRGGIIKIIFFNITEIKIKLSLTVEND